MAIKINHTNNTLSSNSGTFIFGTGIVPSIENTLYSTNFSGKYYGDGSALTGLNTGPTKCKVIAENSTPFHICAVTRVASTYVSNDRITNAQGGIFYLCDHDDASNDDCDLYTINNNYCAAQFSAMIVGHAAYNGSDLFTTSMRIDGVATSSGVLNQSKTIHSQAFLTDDACVVFENQALKIFLTGMQTGMNWGVRLDIVGMQGYD